jgi:hypothetical protein
VRRLAAAFRKLKGETALTWLKAIGVGLLTSLFLMVAAEVYLRGIIGETRTGWTPLKVSTVGLLILVPILFTLLARFSNKGFKSALMACLSCWLSFCLFVAIRAFTDHPGLAHDVDRTPLEFARTVATLFVFFGMPLGVVQAVAVVGLRKLVDRFKS